MFIFRINVFQFIPLLLGMLMTTISFATRHLIHGNY